MKHLLFSTSLIVLFFIVSCSNNEEPEYPVFKQPSSISTDDEKGSCETFEYDAYCRIVKWDKIPNDVYSQTTYAAQYSYPDENTIIVKSEETNKSKESWSEQKRCFEETIKLVNGRATSSEGTMSLYTGGKAAGQKTYRLEFAYTSDNHLNTVKHSEVNGIGDNIKEDAWDKAWIWENRLIWENGNLTEYQDFQGHSSPYYTSKFEYSIYAVAYPIVIPNVINNAHHVPLLMQGVFGLNSANLLESYSVFEQNGNLNVSYQFAYQFDQGQIIEFTETALRNLNIYHPVTYTVSWIEE